MEDVVLQARKTAYRYGLKPNEFWSLTPHETNIYVEGRIEHERSAFNAMGHQAWNIVNFSRKKRLEKADQKHFIIGKTKPQQGQTMEQMKAQAKANTIMLGGKVK